MAIEIVELHPAKDNKTLNSEWIIIANTGDTAFSTKNCAVAVGKGSQRPVELGKLDPGFVLEPGKQARLITGNPGRKAHGKPPQDDLPSYNLFLNQPVLKTPGLKIVFSLRSRPLATAEFDPKSKSGVAQ